MNADAAQLGQPLCPSIRNNGGMGSHDGIMHFAPQERKRLLRYENAYRVFMESPNTRLKAARKKIFDTAVEAADALGIPRATYIGHENGHRGFPAKRAVTYAKRFKVREEWLLYGKGDRDAPELIPSENDLQEMLKIALDAGVDMQTRLADLPRIVAPTLRGLLERYVADRSHPDGGKAPDHDTDAQSPAPTR